MVIRSAEMAPMLRFVVYGACIVIIVAGLRAAAPILTPLALAAFAAAVSLPALSWLRRRGASTGLAILVIMLLDTAIVSLVGWVMLRSVADLRARLPDYLARGQNLPQAIRTKFLELGIEIDPDYYATLLQPGHLLDVVTAAARNATSLLALFLLMLLVLVFILAESMVLPEKLRLVFGPATPGIAAAAAGLGQLQHYLLLKTLVSLLTGAAIGSGAALLGVDFALFWGFLACLLNFSPTIGSLIAAVPAVLLALFQLGPERAIALAAVYVGVNVLLGSFAEPIFMGRQLRLSPIVILVALVFWGWTWGPIGMFLAVPLTIALRIAFENRKGLAKLATLMGHGKRWAGPPTWVAGSSETADPVR